MNKYIKIEALEKAVIDLILQKEDTLLRKQFANSRVLSREFTGTGFYTNYEVPDLSLCSSPQLNTVLPENACVEAIINGLTAMGFVLFIRDGKISFLEGYTYGEEMPENIEGFTLRRF
ncbi:MAG: hypothetical protein A2017_15880 [Lentisphaerae bacterium GWF2_44_16]|nr:MAG: hypothetical protein A2017_15880 [Lentisphaerae bacterium GWF2_44_16]